MTTGALIKKRPALGVKGHNLRSYSRPGTVHRRWPHHGSIGAGVDGAVGGVAGAPMGLGIPKYEAKSYERRIKNGGILLSVHCDDSEWTKKRTLGTYRREADADYGVNDKPRPSTAKIK
jgi:hypothetical protein